MTIASSARMKTEQRFTAAGIAKRKLKNERNQHKKMSTTQAKYIQFIPEKKFDAERKRCQRLIEDGYRFGGMTKNREYPRTIARELSFYRGEVGNVEVITVKNQDY